jgi:oxygen-independent coproporphyrinogen-3 oxidase
MVKLDSSREALRMAAGGLRLDAEGTPNAAGTASPQTEAAGLYVHVPFCRSKCRYCGFYSVPVAGGETGRLVAGLLRELERYEAADFRTAYIGGGSPTALPGAQLTELVRRIRARCPNLDEFTVECNPGQVSADLLATLRRAGVTRLSFGAQSFRARELALLGRGHCVEDIGHSVALARQAGFDNVGLDLIFALPGSTLGDWQYSVAAALGLGVQHVSAYSLSFEAGTVFEAWQRAGRLEPVDEELDRAMYEWAIERLERAGLRQYEISNFARPGCECRHNLGYWGNRPYVGIGPGAASCWRGRRTTNERNGRAEPAQAGGDRPGGLPREDRPGCAADLCGAHPPLPRPRPAGGHRPLRPPGTERPADCGRDTVRLCRSGLTELWIPNTFGISRLSPTSTTARARWPTACSN